MDVVMVSVTVAGIATLLTAGWVQIYLAGQYDRMARRVDRLERVGSVVRPQQRQTALPIQRGYGDPISTAVNAPRLGSAAPDFRLPDDDGKAVGLSAFRGQSIFLIFWSPTCSHCMEILNIVRESQHELAEGSTQLLVVSTGPAGLHKDLHLNAPVLLDTQSATRLSFGAPGTPSAVMIDADGTIASTLARGGPSVLALLRRAPHIRSGTTRQVPATRKIPV